MTPETLNLLRNILINQQIAVGAEDFLATATVAATALAELDRALAAEPEGGTLDG